MGEIEGFLKTIFHWAATFDFNILSFHVFLACFLHVYLGCIFALSNEYVITYKKEKNRYA